MNRRLLCVLGALLSFSSLFSGVAFAQDNNYWKYAYGTRSALLGGAVVAGVKDTSAGFYNPGALGFIDNPSLSVSANAYQYEKISLDNGAGEGEDLTSGQFNVVPTLISGMYRFEQSPAHTIGYQIITRNRSTTSANARRDEVADVLLNPFAPGPEDYIGQYNYDTDLTEVWGGLSYAYKGWEKVSVGFTNFLSVRTQKLNESAQARAINRNTFVAGISDASTHYDYYNLRALWKAGIAADLDPLKVGFTVTTPSVGIVSAGTVSRDVTVVNVDINDDGFPDSFVADDRQNNLDATFKSPASVGWGLEYAMSERTKLAAAAEWFGAMGRYNVIEPESRDFLRPSGINLFDSKDFLAVTDAADDVFNWAVGIEHQFTDKDDDIEEDAMIYAEKTEIFNQLLKEIQVRPSVKNNS